MEKYNINVESDNDFVKILSLFRGYPTYQAWALGMLYSNVADIETIEMLSDWVKENKRMIRTLERENVILYCDKVGINQLLREIEGIKIISTIKKTVARFNTRQRKALTRVLLEDVTPLSASSSESLKKWAEFFVKFEDFSDWRKNNFVKKASGIDDVNVLLDRIERCFDGDYDWNKESFLDYMKKNTPNVEVVFDNGCHLIVKVPDFESARKLAGNGRTEWCIAMREEMWDNYLEGRTQYFIYDFKRPDCDAFANIAFTVNGDGEIDFAQTIDNNPMVQGYDDGVEYMDINIAIDYAGANIADFTTKQI